MTSYVYSSVLRDYIEGVIRQKRSLGFSYDTEARILLKFDRFCTAEGCTQPRLDRTLVEAWNAKRPNESPATRMGRISALRQLALYMVRMDLPAYVTPTRHHPKVPRYVPYIFSATELGALFAQIDSCTYCCEVPYRQRVMPLLFRLLYGCGLRLSEALCLHLADVDLKTGVLTIRDAKFHKDRLVPMTEELLERCLDYAQLVHRNSEPEALFFVGRPGYPLGGGNVYKNFRRFLWQAGISHGGWGKGPRVHDFRHPNLNKIPTLAPKRCDSCQVRERRLGFRLHFFGGVTPQNAARPPLPVFHFFVTVRSFSSSRVARACNSCSRVMSR